MPMKKTANLTSDLVATKGNASPVQGSTRDEKSVHVNYIPMNFRVSADFRRRFKMFAASHDLKLNELLQLSFDDYEKRNK